MLLSNVPNVLPTDVIMRWVPHVLISIGCWEYNFYDSKLSVIERAGLLRHGGGVERWSDFCFLAS